MELLEELVEGLLSEPVDSFLEELREDYLGNSKRVP